MRYLASAAVLAVASVAQQAEACSGCWLPSYRGLEPLPANATGVPCGDGGRIFRADGGSVAAEPIAEGLRPTEPLTPGEQLTVTRVWDCGVFRDLTLTVADTTPMPSMAGTLRITPRSGTYVTFTNIGSCTDRIIADGVRVELVPSPELGPWMELMTWTASIDGEIWRTGHYSTAPPDFEAFGNCGNLPRGAEPGLPPGAHYGELSVHLTGLSGDLPALPFDVTVDCKRARGCNHVPLPMLVLAIAVSRRARRRTTRHRAPRPTSNATTASECRTCTRAE